MVGKQQVYQIYRVEKEREVGRRLCLRMSHHVTPYVRTYYIPTVSIISSEVCIILLSCCTIAINININTYSQYLVVIKILKLRKKIPTYFLVSISRYRFEFVFAREDDASQDL